MNPFKQFLIHAAISLLLIHISQGIKCYECGSSIRSTRRCSGPLTFQPTLCIPEEDGEVLDACGLWSDPTGTPTTRRCLSTKELLNWSQSNGAAVTVDKCYVNVTSRDPHEPFQDALESIVPNFCSCSTDGCNRNTGSLPKMSLTLLTLANLILRQ